MADYYPLIARAIAGLDPSAPGESRRALYERARTALITQLRSVEPPLERVRNHPRTAVAGRGRAQGRVRGGPARPRRHPSGWRACAGGSRAGDAFRATTRPPVRAPEPPPGAAAQPGSPPQEPSSPPRPRPPSPSAPRNDRRRSGRKIAIRVKTRDRRAICAPMRRPCRVRRSRRPRCRSRNCRRPANGQGRRAGAPTRQRRRPRGMRGYRDIAAMPTTSPRRGAGQPGRAENLCQRTLALAGIRPARAEPG